MATAQQIWDDAQAKSAARKDADAKVETDKNQLVVDTATAQQAATDEAAGWAQILAKFPEGQTFVFGTEAVTKFHGMIVTTPVIDPSTDLG